MLLSGPTGLGSGIKHNPNLNWLSKSFERGPFASYINTCGSGTDIPTSRQDIRVHTRQITLIRKRQ